MRIIIRMYICADVHLCVFQLESATSTTAVACCFLEPLKEGEKHAWKWSCHDLIILYGCEVQVQLPALCDVGHKIRATVL